MMTITLIAFESTGLNPHKVELKVSKVVLSLIGAWAVAWTPYAVVALIGISGHSYLLKVNNSFNFSTYILFIYVYIGHILSFYLNFI